MEDVKIDVTQVVKYLQENMRKEGTVLVLGARAGGFFRSQNFYNALKLFGNPSFSQLPRTKQFGECYKLLIESQNFTSDGIDTILIASLNDVEIIDADTYVAKLLKQGVFDVIISTNVDNLLEQVLEKQGMKELHDFDVFSPKLDKTIRSERKFSHRIIKVYGELRTRDYAYTMMPDIRLRIKQNFEEVIKKELARNVLAIGLDPVWDVDILNTIPSQGEAFWYISEEEPEEFPALHEISKARQSEFLSGINGSYSNVLKELYELLIKRSQSETIQTESAQADTSLKENRELIEGIQSISNIPIISPLPEVSLPEAETTLEIFISYVPEDEKLFNKLTNHLSTLRHQKIINIWHQHRITAGEYRKNEIDRYLNSSSVILLLVSADFNASEDYIHGVELERAIELHKGGKARVIPVILRPVDWSGTPFDTLSPLPTDGKAITLWDNQDSAFLDIVKGIKNVIEDLKK